MFHAKSEMVRMNAATSVMTTLKPPEDNKIEIDINVKEDSAIASLQATVALLTAQQKDNITAGLFTAESVAHSRLTVGDSNE